MFRCCVFKAKHEIKYSAKLSKRGEEELEAEEFRRKKSIAERSTFYSTIMCCCTIVKGKKERKRIYIAPFIYYVYLKPLRHGSHSFTCKYTMPAFPSYAFTRWRHL